MTLVADSGGVVGIELRRGAAPGEGRPLMLSAVLDEEIRPLVHKLAEGLYTARDPAGARGRQVRTRRLR